MSTTGIGGYNCAVCGAWVPHGVVHSCGGVPSSPPPAPVIGNVRWDRMSDVRIADALERTAKALEAIAAALAQDAEQENG